MGGEISREKTPRTEEGGEDIGEEGKGRDVGQEDKGRDVGGSHDSSPTTHSTEPPESSVDVPQRRMGDRTVDDMSFMISCTNWC